MVIATIRAERDEKANPHHSKWKQAVAELEQNGYAIIENAISAEQVSRILTGASHCVSLRLTVSHCVSQPLLALTAHCSLCLTGSHCVSLALTVSHCPLYLTAHCISLLTVSHCSLYLTACLAGARDYLKEVTRDDSANALTFSADFLDMIDVPDVLDVVAHWLGPNLYVNHSHVASRPAGVSLTLSDCHYSLHFWLTLSRLAAHTVSLTVCVSLSFSLCVSLSPCLSVSKLQRHLNPSTLTHEKILTHTLNTSHIAHCSSR